MLALVGLATVLTLLGLILSRRMSPLVALIAVPTAASLLTGFGMQTGAFILTGLQQTASVAAMFVFAILYFGIMSDAGLLDPIVDRILRGVARGRGGSWSGRRCSRCSSISMAPARSPSWSRFPPCCPSSSDCRWT